MNPVVDTCLQVDRWEWMTCDHEPGEENPPATHLGGPRELTGSVSAVSFVVVAAVW